MCVCLTSSWEVDALPRIGSTEARGLGVCFPTDYLYPSSPVGSSSPPAQQPLHQAQGQGCRHETHRAQTCVLNHFFFFTPEILSHLPPRTSRHPSHPHTLSHLCSPAPALSFPCPSHHPLWQWVMNGPTLLLSSAGLVLTEVAHLLLPSPICLSKTTSLSVSGLKPYGTR